MKERCGAKNRAGNPCSNVAGKGTTHVGYGRCSKHGGNTPSGIKHGERMAAESAVVTYGLPREVTPHQALEEELWRTAGHVAWLASKVAAFEDDSELKQYAGSDDGMLWEKPAVWIELYHRERKHFAEIAKTCVAVGIEERRVRLAEQQGELLAGVIRGVLTDLGVIDRPEVPRIVRQHLTLIAGDG